MKRRALLLVLSVLVAAVGTALIAVYVRNADNRALEGQRLVKVLVAKEDIPVGTTAASVITETKAGFKDIQVDALAQDALTAAKTEDKDLMGQLGSAAISIPAGTPLQESFFPAAGAQKVQAKTGNRLVMIGMSGPERLAGLISVGDTVTVVATPKNAGSTSSKIVPAAQVVSIDGAISNADDASGAPAAEGTGSTVGLSVSERESLLLIEAQVHGVALNLISAPEGAATTEQAQ